MNAPNPSETVSATKVDEAPQVTAGELQYHFEGLRSLFIFVVAALIVMTLMLDVFFLRKMMIVSRNQRDEQRPRLRKVAADSKTLTKDFTEALEAFSVTNQDFQAILDKYRPFLLPYKVPPSTGTSTAPAAGVPGGGK